MFRGGRGGGGRGGGGRGFGGGRGGGRGGGGGRRFEDAGPPEVVKPFGFFKHPCQDDIVLKVSLNEEVPYFNAPIYTEDKNQIGKIDEIFGPIRDYFVSVKLGQNIKSKTFAPGDKFYIDPQKLLPLRRFLPAPPGEKKKGGGRGGGRGGGGRGGGRGFGGRGGGGGRGGRGGFGGGRGGGGRGGGGFGRGGGGGGFRGRGGGGGGGFRGRGGGGPRFST